jgi:hypothetical protein
MILNSRTNPSARTTDSGPKGTVAIGAKTLAGAPEITNSATPPRMAEAGVAAGDPATTARRAGDTRGRNGRPGDQIIGVR